MEEEKTNVEDKIEESTPGDSPGEVVADFCELPSFKASNLYSEAKHAQWRGFFRKLKPAMHLHPFHPNIPSIKKLSKKKSRMLTKNMPGLPSNLDTEFYCFESSWLNFSLSELQRATNNFSRGQSLH